MDYSEMLRDRVALAAMLSGPDIVQATRRRRVLCREMAEAMADLDVIVMASAPAEAPRIDNVPKWSGIEKPSFTMPCNVTGFPGDQHLHRLRRGRPAGLHAARRQAVHRADAAARRPCLRDGDALALKASGDGVIPDAG